MKIDLEVNPTILQAALDEDAARAQAIIDSVQSAWDAGESFVIPPDVISALYPRQRKSDSGDEMSAAVKQAEDALRTIAIDGALRRLPREAVKAMCTLEDADALAAVKIFGRELPVRHLVGEWNKRHEGEEIWMPPAFEA